MKKTFKYLLALAALSIAAGSCVKETVHEAGEPDVDGCYGVYFPAQDSELIIDPAEPTQASITVMRTVSDGAIEVPVVVADTSGIFSVSSLVFEDGQSESSISVEFNNSKIGVTYSVSFQIDDPQYASKYSSNPIAFDLKVTREKWNELGPVGLAENFYFGFSVPQDDEYAAILYSNDNDPNLYRLENPFAKLDESCADGSEWLTFRVLQKGDVILEGVEGYETKITEDDLVYFDKFNTGYTNSNYKAKIWLVHPSAFEPYKDAQDKWGVYNRVLQYQENGLPAAVSLAPYYYMFNIGGWSGAEMQSLVITFPGAILTDYSISAEAGETENGEIPVAFTLGVDVSAVKYCVYEGPLSTAAVNKYVAAIGDGTETGAKELDIEKGAVSLSLEKSGIYTIVAVSFDDAGAVQGSCSAEFSYVASGDEENYAVNVNAGIELTSRYEALGYNKTNSVAFYVYGKDLTSVKLGVFPTAELSEDINEDLENLEEVSAENLELINGSGYSDVYGGLKALTDYTLVVWATNGYKSTVKTAEITTDGLANVLLGTGDYTYGSGFLVDDDNNPAVDKGLELFQNPNEANTYVIAPWCSNVDFTFTYDAESGEIAIPMQESGETYYNLPIYVVEYNQYLKYKGATDEQLAQYGKVSSYDAESGTISFAVAYIVLQDGQYLGAFAGGIETFVLAEGHNFPVAADGSQKSSVSAAAKLHVRGFAGLSLEYSPKVAVFSAKAIEKSFNRNFDGSCLKSKMVEFIAE